MRYLSISLYLRLLVLAAPTILFAENVEEGEELRVVIIGSGEKNGDEKTLHEEALTEMFQRIKDEDPDAVFYTGSLIFGLEASETPESFDIFRKRLQTFSELAKKYLGNHIPVYPVIGTHQFANPGAVGIFREHFGIKNTTPLEAYQLAYTVLLDGVQFIVLATDIDERQYRRYQRYVRTMPLLDWLEKELRTDPESIRYRIVIGHEPAFSSAYPQGIRIGLEGNPQRRDRFWNILRENGVLAYFSSHESLFDRSNRQGVWQIITGGASVPRNVKKDDFFFQHYVLLTVPKKWNEPPLLQVFDLNGKKWDEFTLTPVNRPVYQLRISKVVS